MSARALIRERPDQAFDREESRVCRWTIYPGGPRWNLAHMSDRSQGEGSASTPSPAASATNGAHPASRRPPRKSTLTQQQKNQKRQRATQDQLLTLEVEFNKNPTPTASVRERIAEDINMTERSVQIWFQNKCVRLLHQLTRDSADTS